MNHYWVLLIIPNGLYSKPLTIQQLRKASWSPHLSARRRADHQVTSMSSPERHPEYAPQKCDKKYITYGCLLL